MSDMEQLLLDERTIADWLLSGSISGDFAPINFTPEPSIPSQIQSLFAQLPPDLQQRFKRAVTIAIIEWTITSHPLSAIRMLALLAAYVRASAVITQLAHITRSRLVSRQSHNIDAAERDDVSSTVGILLAVICGFAPAAEANTAAEALYYDDHVPQRYAPILLNALCRAYPERYPDYLPRALRIMQRDKEQFHVALILDRVVDVITPKLFAKHLPRMENEAKVILTSLLNESAHSRVRIEASQKTYSVITTFGEATLWECPTSDSHTAVAYDDIHAVYSQLLDEYDPEKLLEETLRRSPIFEQRSAEQ